MKKLSYVLLAAILFFGFFKVNAATEEELKDALFGTVKINGSEYRLDDGTRTAVERYLNEYDVNSSDADYIITRINTAKSILESEGEPNFKNLSSSAKNRLKALVVEIDEHTSVKATVTNGSVVVKDGSGNKFYEVTKLVKQTGSETSVTALIAGISLLIVAAGSFLVVKQVKEN